MSYIHFKSVYNKNYDKVTFDGVSLSLSQLKKLIIEKSYRTIVKQLDFDLEITNADTNEVYRNDNDLITKNSRVHVKRIMKSSTAPLRAQPPKINAQVAHQNAQTAAIAANTPAASAALSFSNTISSSSSLVSTASVSVLNSTPSQSVTIPSTTITQTNITNVTATSKQQTNITGISKSAYDSLAPLNIPSKPIVYMPEPSATSNNLATTETIGSSAKGEESRKEDEKAKLDSILFTSMNSAAAGTNYSINKSSSNSNMDMNGLNANMQAALMQQNKFISGNMWPPRMPIRPLQPNYRCSICKKPGHPKNMCPEAGLIKPEERPKFPSGIPKAKMRPAGPEDKFAMLGPDGYVVPEIEYHVAQIVKKDKAPFLTEEEEEEEERKKKQPGDTDDSQLDPSLLKYPPELKCPFGDHIIKDAVLVPCCGHFVCCDECIREKISNDEFVECPHEECDQEIGSLESITPYHNIRKMVNDYLNDLKLVSKRALTKPSGSGISGSSSDAFLDLLLNDLSNNNSGMESKSIDTIKLEFESKSETSSDEAIKTPNQSSSGVQSPLQDSKISSSQSAAAAAAAAAAGIKLASGVSADLTLQPIKKQDTEIDLKTSIQQQQQQQQNYQSNFNTIQQQQQSALLPTPHAVPIIHNIVRPTIPHPTVPNVPTMPINPEMHNMQTMSMSPNTFIRGQTTSNMNMNFNQTSFNQKMRPNIRGNMPMPGFNQQTTNLHLGMQQNFNNNNNQMMNRPIYVNNMNMGGMQNMTMQGNYNQQHFNPNMYNTSGQFRPGMPMMGMQQQQQHLHQQQYINNLPQMGRPIQMNQGPLPPQPSMQMNMAPQMQTGGIIGPPSSIGMGNIQQTPSVFQNQIPPHQQPPVIMPSQMQIPGQTVGLVPSVKPPITSTIPGSVGMPLMSKEEFYSYQERLRKEAESNKYKQTNIEKKSSSRISRSRSRSYTPRRSYSRSASYSSCSSRSRSPPPPKPRRKHYSRSRSRSTSSDRRRFGTKSHRRSRSRSRQDKYRYEQNAEIMINSARIDSYRSSKNNEHYNNRRPQRSPSPRNNRNQNYRTIQSQSEYYHRSSNVYRSRSRSPLPQQQQQPISPTPSSRYHRSRSRSPQSDAYYRARYYEQYQNNYQNQQIIPGSRTIDQLESSDLKRVKTSGSKHASDSDESSHKNKKKHEQRDDKRIGKLVNSVDTPIDVVSYEDKTKVKTTKTSKSETVEIKEKKYPPTIVPTEEVKLDKNKLNVYEKTIEEETDRNQQLVEEKKKTNSHHHRSKKTSSSSSKPTTTEVTQEVVKQSKHAEKRSSSKLMPTIEENITVSFNSLSGRTAVLSAHTETMNQQESNIISSKKKKKSSTSSASSLSSIDLVSHHVENTSDQVLKKMKEGSATLTNVDQEIREKEKKSSKHKKSKKHKKHKHRSASKSNKA